MTLAERDEAESLTIVDDEGVGDVFFVEVSGEGVFDGSVGYVRVEFVQFGRAVCRTRSDLLHLPF
ncbi:hypothetical protein C486_03424 [Natrinema gari JCM 14663]|uniref:Uncharacterized protein n=1 Tax=Natrinema gari JCM 14663 TaxID=1230459 RepID=L9Z938_9EURY|nr:hypothetical protein C486_03424 [Natrinema gari JCM 14663]